MSQINNEHQNDATYNVCIIAAQMTENKKI